MCKRVEEMKERKMRDPLKIQLGQILATLEVYKELEEKREVSFYDTSGQLNNIGEAARYLQKIINDIDENLESAKTKSGIKQFFKRRSNESKFESITQDLEAAAREFCNRAGKMHNCIAFVCFDSCLTF